jgi:hypothetical protein
MGAYSLGLKKYLLMNFRISWTLTWTVPSSLAGPLMLLAAEKIRPKIAVVVLARS